MRHVEVTTLVKKSQKNEYEAVLNTFDQTQAWSIRSLSANIGIPRSSLHDIITKKLKYKKLNAKWAPHQLDSGQKYMSVITSRGNLKDYNQTKKPAGAYANN